MVVFGRAIEAFDGVDIAVNTVGKVLRKPIVETTEAGYDSMFDINSKAAFFFLEEAGRRLNDNGRVITIVTSPRSPTLQPTQVKGHLYSKHHFRCALLPA